MHLVAKLDTHSLINSNGLFINYKKEYQLDNIAVPIRKSADGILYISELAPLSRNRSRLFITFKNLCEYLSKNMSNIGIHCILLDNNLEMDIKVIADQYDVFDQVIYSGNVKPMYISKWNRDQVFYNIENCLPRIYAADSIKKAHLEVANYFCRRYSIELIQIEADYFSENVKKWCDENNLSLVVQNPTSLENIKELEKKNIAYIIADLELVLEYQRMRWRGVLKN